MDAEEINQPRDQQNQRGTAKEIRDARARTQGNIETITTGFLERRRRISMDTVSNLEMTEYKQWLLWKFDKGRKVPLNEHGMPSGVDREHDFMDYETALAASNKLAVQGVAFVFTKDDPFIGVDLDDAVTSDFRIMKPWAADIATELNCYTEISPSLKGLKIFAKGKLPEGARNRFSYYDGEVEVYEHGRFFTVTGCDIYGYKTENAEVDIAKLLERIAPKREEPKLVEFTGGGMGGDLEERARGYLSGITLMQGSRNNTAFSAAGSIAALLDDSGRGLSEDMIHNLMQEWNGVQVSALTSAEIKQVTQSALRNGTPRAPKPPNMMTVREDLPMADLSSIIADGDTELHPANLPEATEEPEEHRLDDSGGLAFPDIEIPGLVGDIQKFITESALYPQPQLALGAAFAVVSGLIGRKLKTTTGVRGNVYVLGLAPSGSGKQHPLTMLGEILYAAGAGDIHGPASIGSAPGLISQIVKQPCTVFGLDEVGHLFSAITSAKGGSAAFLSMINKVLLELFSAAGARDYTASCYADAERTDATRVSHPYCSFLGMSTPDTFFNGMTKESLSDGLLARMFIVSGEYVLSVDDFEEVTIPDDITRRCRQWAGFKAENDMGMIEEKVVPFSPEAKERVNSHRKAIEGRRKTDDPNEAALWSRANARAVKFALMIAAGRHTPAQGFRIELSDVDIGIKLANHGTRWLIHQAEKVGNNQWEKVQQEMYDFIRSSKNGKTITDINRQFRGMRARDRSEAITSLQGQGRIDTVSVPTKGRPVTRVTATQ